MKTQNANNGVTAVKALLAAGADVHAGMEPCRGRGSTCPQRVYVEVDCRARTISADYSGEVGNAVRASVLAGDVQRFRVSWSYLGANVLNVFMYENIDLAARICDGYTPSGPDTKASFSEDALRACEELEYKCKGEIQ